MTQWKPILTGDDAQRARRYVEELDSDFQKAFAQSKEVAPWQAASLALFYAYLYLDSGDERHETLVDHFVDVAIEGTGEAEMRPALYGGFTGIGWVLEHLDSLVEEELVEEATDESAEASGGEDDGEEDEEGAEVDEALFSFLGLRPWKGDYDLIGGLVGMGVYFVERHPDEAGAEGLRQLIDHFEEIAVETETGITWLTSPQLLPEWQRELAPDGYYNLGLAHGVPGIVALLGHAIAQGVEVDRARKLMQGAIRWILSRRREGEVRLLFRSWEPVDGDAEDDRSGGRLAWCYNDLGLGAALFLAARQGGDKELENEAIDILRHCAKIPEELAGINDAPLCHGTVGVAHIFNRIYQATGDSIFHDAAIRWYEATYKWHRPGRGFGGFQSYAPFDYSDGQQQDQREDPWDDDPSFLSGSLGLGLALLAAINSVPPNWDRLLLVDVPPRIED